MVEVVTVLLNAQPDPQRGITLPADPGLVADLAGSVLNHGGHLTVLTDCLPAGCRDGIDWVEVPPGGNPYFHRWQVIASHIATATGWVWCVDATDVELLNTPAPDRDVLHIGSEDGLTVGFPWMHATNPDHRRWIAAHPHLPLLNPGIVGGPVPLVERFARHVAAAEDRDLTDMGAANCIAYEQHPDHITGHPVHTRYRADERTAAWWKHK